MQPIPYLFFNGTCREAMTFYARTFDKPDTLAFTLFKDMPAESRANMPGTPHEAVMHAMVAVGEGWLYGSDDPTGPVEMKGVNVSLAFPTEAETRRVFDALSDGGEVRMPLTPMSWAPLFSMFTDRFGIRWMIQQDPA